jgi:hypothetical protein
MRSPVFIDTSYVLALVNLGDEYHVRAAQASEVVQPPFLTTEAVLVEIGNALARARWRDLAVATIHDLRSDASVEVVSVDTALLERALALFEARYDKEWGLTDCISFVVMQERDLTYALTTDRHFVQAGFHSALADTRGT